MREPRDNPVRTARLALCLGAILVSSGCYRRVVRAEGWGYENTVVEEPYATDGPVEDMLFGKQKPERREPAPSKPPRGAYPD